MEITLEEIQKKFEGLPENLKWAIMAANVDDNIIELGKREDLKVEQLGQLSLETHMVMFGFTPPEKFEESVQKSLQLPREKTHIIVEAINDTILKKIREEMGGTPNNPPAKNEEGNNTQVLSNAGIEIIPEKLEIPITEKTPSILAQKLSAPMQTPPVKTDHTLPNITPPASPSKPAVDPYREIPE